MWLHEILGVGWLHVIHSVGNIFYCFYFFFKFFVFAITFPLILWAFDDCDLLNWSHLFSYCKLFFIYFFIFRIFLKTFFEINGLIYLLCQDSYARSSLPLMYWKLAWIWGCRWSRGHFRISLIWHSVFQIRWASSYDTALLFASYILIFCYKYFIGIV